MNMFVHLLLTATVGLCSCYEDSNSTALGQPHLSGPSEALLKKVVEFYCEVLIYPQNEAILLQLFKEGDRSKVLGVFTSLNGTRGVFPVVIKTFHDGNLECMAKGQNNTAIKPTVSSPIRLRVIEPVNDAVVSVSSGQTEFFEGRKLELECKLEKGSYVTYQWLLDGQPVTEEGHRYFNESYFRVNRTTSKDSGSYMCIAQNSYNETIFISNSSAVDITIKDVVSTPDISFTVLKEDFNYSALVSCHSLRGTPPIIFSLYNSDKFIANATVDDRNTTFPVPIVLSKYLGWLQCRADNGDKVAYSQRIPLEVVPVEGPVTLHYDYDSGQNYMAVGVKFYCKASKGSHPKFEWFLNKTLLHGSGHFYYVVDQPPERSILLLEVGRSSAGTYHCQVSDDFDKTTAVRSKRTYLDKQVLNKIPDSVVGTVFGCFALIIIMVCCCCVFGIVYRARTSDAKPLVGVKMNKMLAASDEDLDFSEYAEDTEDIKEPTADEFDQASQESVDDWPWLKTEETSVLEQEEDQPVLLP